MIVCIRTGAVDRGPCQPTTIRGTAGLSFILIVAAMTIPVDAPRHWCPSCGENWDDPGRICHVCGTELLPQRRVVVVPRDRLLQEQDARRGHEEVMRVAQQLVRGQRRLEEDVEQQREIETTHALGTVLRQLQDLTARVNRHSDDIVSSNQQLQQMLHDVLQQQQEIVAGMAWDLAAGAAAPSPSRGTSSSYLDAIPRVVLEPTSAILFRATLQVGTSLECRAVPGEFGHFRLLDHSTTKSTHRSTVIEKSRLVVASPRTGKGGLSADTCRQIGQQQGDDAYSSSSSCIVYLDRGDTTFVQKGYVSQQAGANAVVIGNTMAEPWPYTMRDSTDEATKLGLHIPVVMVKQADAKAITALARTETDLQCRLEIQSSPPECVVCLNLLQVGDTVLTLPACGHVFHEECVVAWLQAHNTCPYCRRELPTDDVAYEQERRRVRRTHAAPAPPPGTSTANQSSTANDFYG